MANIALLEKVKASVLNEERMFNMNVLSTCFVGHTLRVVMGEEAFSDYAVGSYGWPRRAMEELGISQGEATDLFYEYTLFNHRDRHWAADKLQALIDKHKPAPVQVEELELELVGV